MCMHLPADKLYIKNYTGPHFQMITGLCIEILDQHSDRELLEPCERGFFFKDAVNEITTHN